MAGKIDRAYRALEVYNYFKAKRLFYKRVDNEVVAASYGLSLIYGRNDNPFSNLDSAYKFIYQAADKYPSLKIKQQEKIKELGIDSAVIQIWKDTIDYHRFLYAKKEMTVTSMQEYIDAHSQSKWKSDAIKMRDELAFTNAKQENTAESYQYFLQTYPDAVEYNEAKKQYEIRLYETQTADGKLKSYENFVKEFPKSPFNNKAQDSVYYFSTATNRLKDYHYFILNHPQNRNVARAWRSIYNLSMVDYSPDRIAAFTKAYPDYPFKDELSINIKLANKTYLPFRQNDSWGFMDTLGKVLLSLIYNSVEPFKEGLALVVKDGKLGYINKLGIMVIPFIYEDGESFNKGYAVVEKGGFFGLIDRTNTTVASFKYELIGQFSDGLALVANDTAYGFINEEGKEIIPLKYSYASDFAQGYAMVEKNEKKGMINQEGDVIIPLQYTWLESFDSKGVCRAKNDSLFGLLDRNDSTILPFIYDAIGPFSDNLAIVAKKEKYGYVNRNGEIKIPLKYDFKAEVLNWGQFKNGYANYLLKDKIGIIDTLGERVFPAIFENVGFYNDSSWIAVKKKGQWGFSNQQLQLKINYQYDFAETFEKEYARVKKGDMWGLINKMDEPIIPFQYESIQYIKAFGYLIKDKYGIQLLNEQLMNLSNTCYTSVVPYQRYFLRLEEENDLLYIDKRTSQFIIPFFE